jgi:ATP-dependent DNA helicase RecG
VEANHGASAIRVLGLLLFGKEEALRQRLPTHEVAFQVLRGTRVEVNDFYRWPLMRLMEELLSRFRARNREEELMVGILRIGVADYSQRGFREGVANALIHRDYTRLGAVHVQFRDDEIVISNPGSFPEGVHLDNLLVTPPQPRNPLLADAFKRAGIVERTARGIDTIYYEQLRNGRPAPSYERSTGTTVVVQFPGGRANLDFVRLAVEENQSGRLLSLDDLLVLNALWLEREINAGRAAALIQKPDAEARRVLVHLAEAGLVEARGEGNARKYHFSAQTYRRLGIESAYSPMRGLEPRQQEQRVLKHVKEHGGISRREAAELCRLSSPQARYLLKRLVDKGLLTIRGRGRATVYVRSSKNTDKSKKKSDKSN